MARKFSSRLDRLGTETAYAVAEEAKRVAESGKKVYALHIGDINIPTPKIICDAAKKAIEDGKTGYCSAQGIPELKETLATYLSRTRNVQYSKEEISVQPGGKPTIGKFLMCIMEEGEEVLYPTPGYPIYESQINFCGGVAKPYIYRDNGSGFEIDLEYLEKQITSKTRVLIYNNYQNPIGCASSDEEMQAVADLAIKHDLWVLSDEAYFQLVFEPLTPKSIVQLPGMFERTLILYTFSKEFSMTGWRLGCAAGPKDLIQYINKLNTNFEACTTHFVQHAGIAALTLPEAAQFSQEIRALMKERRDLIVPLANRVPGFRAYSPQSTFYLFVNVTEAMKMRRITDVEEFRKTALKETGVSFCTRDHFGASLPFEKEKYIRFAFSSADNQTITEAFAALTKWMSDASLATNNNIENINSVPTSPNPSVVTHA